MKKLIVILATLMALAIPAAAQLQVGGTAIYLLPEVVDPSQPLTIYPELLSYGGEARLVLGPFEGSAQAIYSPGSETDFGAIFLPTMTILADAGLGVDLLGLVRVGAEAGLNYLAVLSPEGGAASSAGVNVRVLATASLLGLNVGVSATGVYNSFDDLLSTTMPPAIYVGLSVLLNL